MVNDKELVAIGITFYNKELSSRMVPQDSMRQGLYTPRRTKRGRIVQCHPDDPQICEREVETSFHLLYTDPS